MFNDEANDATFGSGTDESVATETAKASRRRDTLKIPYHGCMDSLNRLQNDVSKDAKEALTACYEKAKDKGSLSRPDLAELLTAMVRIFMLAEHACRSEKDLDFLKEKWTTGEQQMKKAYEMEMRLLTNDK